VPADAATPSRSQVEELHGQAAVPLVTGGTTYWVQHLLFPLGKPAVSTSLTAPAVSDDHVPFSPSPSRNLPALLESLPEPLTAAQHALLYSLPTLPLKPPEEQSLAIWQLLERVDPLMAAKWHWRDTRKVLRGLERIWNEGARESALWEEQARRRAETQGQSAGDKR
jgi:tRNA dimethylallyltransferase